jgi:hypothetical protein
VSIGPGGGGYSRPPLENAAAAALAAARGRMGSGPRFPLPPPQKLTAEEKAEALSTIAQGGACGLCGGIHAAAEYGCPRLASFRRDADGVIVEGTFWPDGSWDRSGIVFATDATEGEAGDGAH